MKKGITQEKMRYFVPNEVNNFWSTHRRFIILCAFSTIVIFVIALSISIIINIHKMEPKITFLFFCEVEDYDTIIATTKKYENYAIYFIKYEDRFKKLDGTGDNFYDLSPLGLSDNYDLNSLSKVRILNVYNKNLSIMRSVDYEDVQLEPGTRLNVSTVINIIESIVS